MSHKQMPRLGSAIASTILSLFSAVSLVGVDKAQAAVLTYKIDYSDRSYFKMDTSLLEPVVEVEEYEATSVLEGRLYEYTLAGGKAYYDLAGASILFYQGELVGLNMVTGSDYVRDEFNFPGDELDPPFYGVFTRSIYWYIIASNLYGSYEESRSYNGGPFEPYIRFFYPGYPLTYTLVKTEPSPVPEPLTAGGTALALAGLSWLKHKKKMAA